MTCVANKQLTLNCLFYRLGNMSHTHKTREDYYIDSLVIGKVRLGDLFTAIAKAKVMPVPRPPTAAKKPGKRSIAVHGEGGK